MPIFSKSATTALAILAVDNIRLTPASMALLAARDRGEISRERFKEQVRQRAYRLAGIGNHTA
ncbi:hypothetical protein ACF3NA_00930 [Alkanindiges sp. WGS2144]|uniref:hypothetical protein n=1 Tax=Alkanindiges sp. WGS2144 TaxID=3366808 RepID=UPI003752416A